MPALVHTSFRVSNAKQFRESFEERSQNEVGGYIPINAMRVDPNTQALDVAPGGITDTTTGTNGLNRIPFFALDDQMYLFIGRVAAWTSTDTPDGSIDPNINENNPPNPVDSVKDSHFNHWDDMIAAKKVSSGEVSHVVKRERADEIKAGVRNWKTGLKYDGYDDRLDNLFDDDMLLHTVNQRFRVYKAIKQGVGRFKEVSVDGSNTYIWDFSSYREPLNFVQTSGISEDFMIVDSTDTETEKNDGYQWKYYYTIDAGEALKFVTTSYIPVRTIRRENGNRINDFSDQYTVEENATNGTIMNVLVEKNPVVDSAGTLHGYDIIGGDGFYQFATSTATADLDTTGTTGLLRFTILKTAINNVDPEWPDKAIASKYAGATNAVNQFDFTAGAAAAAIAGKKDAFIGYGVVVKAGAGAISDVYKKYVFPIKTVAESATELVLTIDDEFINSIVGNSAAGIAGLSATTASAVAGLHIEVHPRITIEPNHQATTIVDPIDGFNAYAIVEPIFDSSANPKVYKVSDPGRIIDVRVTNPGKYHYRIDSAKVMPDVSTYSGAGTFPAAANTAKVHATISPVGGHGFDPVAEFGGFNVMINARFEGTESDEFTVGNEFRKIGILKNPLSYDAANLNKLWQSKPTSSGTSYSELFRNFKTDQCYRVNLNGNSYAKANTAMNLFFEPDMDIGFYATGTITSNTYASGLPIATKTYNAGELVATARVVDHDTVLERLRVIKPRKDFFTVLEQDHAYKIESLTLHSVQSDNVVANTVATNTALTPGMMPGSGKVLYVENRSMVSRSQNQTEDLKISIQF